jgi:hypothetical protein
VVSVRVFLDVCCLNRPFDDQRQVRINLEATAVLHIVQQIQDGRHEMISSDSLVLETSRNTDVERRARVMQLLELAVMKVEIGPEEAQRANDLAARGFGAFDALHIACAESGSSDVFLTTDDALLRRARRYAATIRVRVVNPVTWMAEAHE